LVPEAEKILHIHSLIVMKQRYLWL